MARRWFDDTATVPKIEQGHSDDGRAMPRPFSYNRPMTAAASRLDLKKAAKNNTTKRSSLNWQEAAWDYYDQISEVKFAFNTIGQLVSRVTCHAAFVSDANQVPISCHEITDTFEDFKGEYASSSILEASNLSLDLVHDLMPPGLQSSFIQQMALNLSIAGEAYIVHNAYTDRYIVASINELVVGGSTSGRSALRQARSGGADVPLTDDAYIARVWRRHPRYSSDADSSMRGVLDACEQLLLTDQTIRAIMRSNLNAGAVVFPSGLTAANGQGLEEALIEITTMPVEDETSGYQVNPLLLTGSEMAVNGVKRIEFARPLEETLLQTQDRALERILRGIDVPKDIISGLADIKYANAIAVDDNLFKAHIEPLIMLICDALSSVFLQPALKNAGVDPELAEKFVIWYNPSQIVTRPDRSQAANEGYDRKLLSADAWRTARGFSELDAPTQKELLQRLTLDKAQIPPEMAAALIEALAPNIFKEIRKEASTQAGVDPALQGLLQGEVGTPVPDVSDAMSVGSDVDQSTPSPLDSVMDGGEVTSPGGNLPPRTPYPGQN